MTREGTRSLIVLSVFVAACQGPVAHPSPVRRSGEVDMQHQRAVVQQRGIARRRELLERLLGIDRRELEIAEQSFRNAEVLHDSGRMSDADLADFEVRVLACRRQLLRREYELAELEAR